jgi:citrate lyase subunit beta/citryl-CoA lyase
MLAKAWASAADEIVIDLEDSVPAGSKAEARETAARFLRSIDDTGPDIGLDIGRDIAVRVNAPGSPWCHEDLVAVGSLPRLPHSVVLPKVESVGDLAFAERLLDGVESGSGRSPVAVQALIESAAGLARLGEIATAGGRLRRLIIGYADLAASLGRSHLAPADHWTPAQEQLIWAARAAGILAIDGPHLGVAVDESFRAGLRRAAEAGFDGKWVIHPSQIDEVNTAFSPSADDVAWADEVIEALESAEGRGIGAVSVRGRMLDEAVAVAARRVLLRARLAATPAPERAAR